MSEVLSFDEKASSKVCQEEREKIKIENMREKHREERLAYREQQRDFYLRKARLLDDESIFSNFVGNDIATLAKSLKNKAQISCDLLNAIMNFLLEGPENITAFLKVDGALQVLLRLLSGQNEKFQLVAAHCICNLALGNKKESVQILKAAESYLMVHLSGRNVYLKEICAIALGNLSMQGAQNIELLMKQGFLPKIISLVREDPSLETAGVYAMTQLVYHGFDVLRPEDLENCFLAVLPIFKKRSFSVSFLMSLLSSSKSTHPQFISNRLHFEALNYLLISLKENEKEVVFYLRILSNLSVEGSVVMDLMESQNQTLRECIRCLLQSEKAYVKKECLSWLGNILNSSVDALKLFGMNIVKENYEVIELYIRTCGEFPSEEMLS